MRCAVLRRRAGCLLHTIGLIARIVQRGAGRLAALALLLAAAGAAHALEPFADTHLHFKWDQKEVITAKQAVQRLRDNNVVLAVVAGLPSETALELRAAGGEFVLPIFSPYIGVRGRYTWGGDERVLSRAREGLQQGLYYGIGEIHLIAGLGPRRDNPVFEGLVGLAEEFDVPLLLHTEASDHRYLAPICQKFPRVRFQWAHAGGHLGPEHAEGILAACPNVWIEFSARDPWHYGTLVDEAGNLLPGWVEVISAHPERFMTGSDPVWGAHQSDRWYEADEGWDHLGKLIAFHRAWMKQLPPAVEEKVRLTNALKFYRVAPPAP